MSETGCRYSKSRKILPSMCDGASRLSIPAALDMFQDIATLHADKFDIGPEGMNRRRYFWIITKTRMVISRMPEMMEDVSLNTWIQAPERVSCERDFSITSGGETLIYARSIWAVISRDTGRLVHMDGLYPEIEFSELPPDDMAFARIGKDFTEGAEAGSYTIRSVDIDLGGHMNNVNYVRAALGCFSSEKLAEMDIRGIELNYISQSYEGETLTFRTRQADDGLDIGAAGPDGKTVFTARIMNNA